MPLAAAKSGPIVTSARAAAERVALGDLQPDEVLLIRPDLSSGLVTALRLLAGSIVLFAALWLLAPKQGIAGWICLLIQEFTLIMAVGSLIWALVAGLRLSPSAGMKITASGIGFEGLPIIPWQGIDQMFLRDDLLYVQIETDTQAATIHRLEAAAAVERVQGRGLLHEDKALERALLTVIADIDNPHVTRLAVPLGDDAPDWRGLLKVLQGEISAARGHMVAADPVQIQAIRAFIGMDKARMDVLRARKRDLLVRHCPPIPKSIAGRLLAAIKHAPGQLAQTQKAHLLLPKRQGNRVRLLIDEFRQLMSPVTA